MTASQPSRSPSKSIEVVKSLTRHSSASNTSLSVRRLDVIARTLKPRCCSSFTTYLPILPDAPVTRTKQSLAFDSMPSDIMMRSIKTCTMMRYRFAMPRLEYLGCPDREGDDHLGRIRVSRRRKYGATHHIEAVHAWHLTFRVNHALSRIVRHPGRPGRVSNVNESRRKCFVVRHPRFELWGLVTQS